MMTQTTPPLLGLQTFANTSKNGLMSVHVSFGMTREPTGGAEEVVAGFTDVVRLLREFADYLEKVNVATPTGSADK